MLCVRAAAVKHFPSSITPFRHSAASFRHSAAFFRRKSPSISSIRMSSSQSDSNQIVEHIVLFKVKPSVDPSAVSAMLTNLNSLSSLDTVLHLSVAPVSRCRSKTLSFTHMLHSRYRSKSDLATYTDHPEHVRVVVNYVRPVVEDTMAVDWVAEDFSGPVEIPPGSAARFTILKLKEEGSKSEVLKVVRGVKDKFPSIEQLTVGENFSPARAKGYSICSVAVFKGVEELEGLESETEIANMEKDKVREFLDGVVVLDFVVPSAVQSASL
ncbi:hypothetical protein ACJIZ3_021395 [Penstemon smallii]|uniref:Stress-response A/B barrel domain-containing protein n=1 Tax=Penstemon smallii TaxID=265156 RepID=A0ABD3SL94_9LAMI